MENFPDKGKCYGGLEKKYLLVHYVLEKLLYLYENEYIVYTN